MPGQDLTPNAATRREPATGPGAFSAESLPLPELVRLACAMLGDDEAALAAALKVSRKAAQLYLRQPDTMPPEQRRLLAAALEQSQRSNPDPVGERVMLALRDANNGPRLTEERAWQWRHTPRFGKPIL